MNGLFYVGTFCRKESISLIRANNFQSRTGFPI